MELEIIKTSTTKMKNNYQQNVNEKYLHSEITGRVLQGFYLIINEIGYGFGL